jgi:hypothetical protein
VRGAVQSSVLIFGIHNTVDWWRCLGANLGLGAALVVTDLRGEGDVSIVDAFYRELHRGASAENVRLAAEEVADVIARCRSLRWLENGQARMMVHAMSRVLNRLLDQVRPRVVLSFPIDRYVKDILERLARKRGIPYLELTASVFSRMSMFLCRGDLLTVAERPASEVYDRGRAELVSPAFLPPYVPRSAKYSRAHFLKKIAYFRARSAAFWAIGRLKRDPLNIHYVDAQWFLGHKPGLQDIRVLRMIDHDWQARLERTPLERRVFFGLQLFPEASIDYWLRNPEFVAHEDCLVEAASAFSRCGYTIVVKDHPLQFGFRQTGLIARLRSLDGVVVAPYEVPAREVLQRVGINFTFTGTLGLQAGLAGMVSACAPTYYSNAQDFVQFENRDDLAKLPAAVERRPSGVRGQALEERRDRIVDVLMRGSFAGDLFTFRGFRRGSSPTDTIHLARAMGRQVSQLREQRGWP